ncbi:MAG: hypothetical protein AB7O59_22240 [Pirellulales bacterium]
MEPLTRRSVIRGLGATIVLGPAAFRAAAADGQSGPAAASPHLTHVNPQYLVTADEARAWHVTKDAHGGPTLAGSPSWRHFLEFTESALRACGMVDVLRNPWNYERWFTTDWPQDENWSLRVAGQKIRVASYGAYSGMTEPAGTTARLVAYRAGMAPAEVRGKIVVVPPGAVGPLGAQAAALGQRALVGDYEYLADADTFPDPLAPRAAAGRFSSFGKLGVESFVPFLREGRAAGLLFVVDLPYDVLAGTYSFRVPTRYDTPTLFLDRESGAQVVEAAKTRSWATLRLTAWSEMVETYQLFGYLPGRDYGTPRDQQIMLITHTDGPSISQDNGALGILGLVQYFSKIPQAERPRTLLVFLDNRHYMPGGEAAFDTQDYAAAHPKIHKPVVAAVGIEHLGQMEYTAEPDKPFHSTGQPELSTVWITKNQQLVDLAIKAVKDNQLRRVQVQCPGQPGIHGGEQGPWFGLGRIAERLQVPGAATMGSMTAYWSTKARMEAFDADHFVRQVATMAQFTGDLMVADFAKLAAGEAAGR